MTAFMREGEIPLIVIESLSHSVAPCRKAPVPSVTITSEYGKR
jgi:hypothetical protein